jgi:hypothetical protein
LLSQLFLKWTLWKCGNLHKPPDSFFLEWSTSNCVDGPECNSQFLAMVIDMRMTFLLTCHAPKIQFKAHIPHHSMSCDNLFSSAQISII